MGVNNGRFKGVGIRRVVAPSFLGQVTLQPPTANLPNVVGVIIQAAPDPSGVLTNILTMFNHTGTAVWNIPIAGGLGVLGAQLSAGTVANGFFGFDGTTNPVSLKAANGNRIYISNNVMNHTNYPNITGVVGDLYMRMGSGAGRTLQRCSTAGSPGTWTTIV